MRSRWGSGEQLICIRKGRVRDGHVRPQSGLLAFGLFSACCMNISLALEVSQRPLGTESHRGPWGLSLTEALGECLQSRPV
jgi:hypothetical protein